MNASLIYFLITAAFSLAVLYTAYLLIFRRNTHLELQRFVLLSIIFLSLLLPFNPVKIDSKLPDFSFPIQKQMTETVSVKEAVITSNEESQPVRTMTEIDVNQGKIKSINWLKIIEYVYLIVFLAFMLRLFFYMFKLMIAYIVYPKEKTDGVTLVKMSKRQDVFAFFHWIFINENGYDEEDKYPIVAHEKIHAMQYHSFDVLLVELLSAVMWFNPIVWMLKKRMKLVHEYLADDGVLEAGTNKIRYQMLLLNQVTEEKFVSFSSNFNNSMLKKRFTMMNKQKFNKNAWRKWFWFLPVIALLAIGTALVNGQNKSKNEKTITKTITVTADNQNNESILGVCQKRNSAGKQYSIGKFHFFSGNIKDHIKMIAPLLIGGKENKTDVFVSLFTEIQNADDISLDTTYFKSYYADSKRFTEMLNKELQRNRTIKSTEQMWGIFYTVKNNPNTPIILNLGIVEKLRNDKGVEIDLINNVISRTFRDFFGIQSPEKDKKKSLL